MTPNNKYSAVLELDPVPPRSYNRLIEPVAFKVRVRQFNASDGTHMTSYFVDLKPKQAWSRPARLATVSLAVVIASGDHIDAASRRNEPSVSSVETRTAGADHGHRFTARPADHCLRQERLGRGNLGTGSVAPGGAALHVGYYPKSRHDSPRL